MNAPPHRAAIHSSPCARVRSDRGSHVVNDLAMIGKQPASPTPKRNRMATIEVKLHAAPVSDVNADQPTTMRMRPLRAPTQSPYQPPGISNRPYPSRKALRTVPIITLSNPSSLEMIGAACAITVRST